ncbi:MAG: MJ0042-type zinc finger domain-containing protein [Bosea sp. (in: a-proteobacteria)]
MLIVCPTCASEYRVEPAQLGPEGRRVRCSSCNNDWFASPYEAVSYTAADEALRGALDDDIEAQWREAALNDPDVAEALAAFEASESAIAAALDDQAPQDIGTDYHSEDGSIELPAEVSEQTAVDVPALAVDVSRKPVRGDKGAGRKIGKRLPGSMPAARPTSRAGIAAAIGLVSLGVGLVMREAIVPNVPALAGPLAMIGLPVNLRGAAFENVASELINDPGGRFLIVQSQVRNLTGRQIPVGPIEIVVRDSGLKPIYTWAAEPPKVQLQPGETMQFRTRLAQPPQEAHDVQLRFQRASAQMAQAAK